MKILLIPWLNKTFDRCEEHGIRPAYINITSAGFKRIRNEINGLLKYKDMKRTNSFRGVPFVHNESDQMESDVEIEMEPIILSTEEDEDDNK